MKEVYKGFTIEEMIVFKTNPGWDVKWQISRAVAGGREPIAGEGLSIEKEISEEEAIEMGLCEARNYIDKNL